MKKIEKYKTFELNMLIIYRNSIFYVNRKICILCKYISRVRFTVLHDSLIGGEFSAESQVLQFFSRNSTFKQILTHLVTHSRSVYKILLKMNTPVDKMNGFFYCQNPSVACCSSEWESKEDIFYVNICSNSKWDDSINMTF